MIHSIPAAVALAVVGSFCFAVSATIQHSAVRVQVDDNQARRHITWAQLGALIRDRTWWGGLSLMAVSLVCQVGGLSMAPVSVVQPVGLLAFPWSILLERRALRPHPWRVLVPTSVTVAATAAFVLVASTHVSPRPVGFRVISVVVAALVVYALAGMFALMGAHGLVRWRSLFWASGGALFYGLEAVVVKSLLEYAATHPWYREVPFWGVVALLIVGSATAGLMIQHGYATGVPEVAVASMTVTSPVVAVVLGIVVLGEGARITGPIGVALAVLGVIAISGVAALAHVTSPAIGQEHDG